MAYQVLSAPVTTPGANTATLVLFNSADYKTAARGPVRFNDFLRYVLTLKNSQAGTLKAFASADGGATWPHQIAEFAVAASTTQKPNIVAIPIEPHRDIRIEWINGGVAQATWYVAQGLDDGQAPLRPIFTDAAGVDPSSSTTVTSTQLPTTLGQKTSAQSMSVVEASDGVQTKAANLRGYIRTEGLPITCGTASKTFTVPASWKGKHVRMQAENSDVYYQISLAAGTPAVCDKAARATETGTNPIALTVAASGNGCFRIPSGTFLDVPFPTNAETFALQANADSSVCRTHLAES